jgi:hypothetical protein
MWLWYLPAQHSVYIRLQTCADEADDTYLCILHIAIGSHQGAELSSSHRGRQALDVERPH